MELLGGEERREEEYRHCARSANHASLLTVSPLIGSVLYSRLLFDIFAVVRPSCYVVYPWDVVGLFVSRIACFVQQSHFSGILSSTNHILTFRRGIYATTMTSLAETLSLPPPPLQGAKILPQHIRKYRA